MLDLDAYFDRIGYQGGRQPTLATLQGLHARHAGTIAFDGLDPWIGRPVQLSLDAIQSKLVTARRGGYCYEHNTLFKAVLDALGFKVAGLSGRVLLTEPPGGGRHPRNHMLLLVDLPEGLHTADVGFGGLTLMAPLRLDTTIVQLTSHERARLTRASTPHGDLDYVLEVETGSQWRKLYQFGLAEQIVPDYEVSNWYMSSHPRSPFTQWLIAARSLPGKRLALSDRQYTIHHLGASSEKRELTDVAELRRVLTVDFGIALPDDPELDRKFVQLFSA